MWADLCLSISVDISLLIMIVISDTGDDASPLAPGLHDVISADALEGAGHQDCQWIHCTWNHVSHQRLDWWIHNWRIRYFRVWSSNLQLQASIWALTLVSKCWMLIWRSWTVSADLQITAPSCQYQTKLTASESRPSWQRQSTSPTTPSQCALKSFLPWTGRFYEILMFLWNLKCFNFSSFLIFSDFCTHYLPWCSK